ncbi:hypothetical protein [Pseudoalteromonas rubra]|uniref:Uncharacterized protein n=1 Tax=Pseudoalteromonas rubra TaxID=43658 RepID=A0A0U3HT09_9GAMM|nr:hypothetical protein [Pseudoalteromonas rubra]ALU44088.1 hypothetical protein AT705_14720 [Pseudoalteromonas rubra]
MADFLASALEAGFAYSDRKKNRLKKELIPGFTWEIVMLEESWNDLEEVGFYLWSPLFSKVMSNLFTEHNELANEYYDRTLVDDEEGCLGFSSVGWEEGPDGKKQLYSAATYLEGSTFFETLQSQKNEEDIFNLLYKGIGVQFLAVVEGLWVYLYLLKRMGLCSTEILSEINGSEKPLPVKTAKPVDLALLGVFEKSYEKAINGENRK